MRSGLRLGMSAALVTLAAHIERMRSADTEHAPLSGVAQRISMSRRAVVQMVRVSHVLTESHH
jgi:hypothetical protein